MWYSNPSNSIEFDIDGFPGRINAVTIVRHIFRKRNHLICVIDNFIVMRPNLLSNLLGPKLIPFATY